MTLILENITLEFVTRYMFIGFIALPLPILLLHGITTSAFLEVRNRVRYKNIKMHYDNIELLTILQLRQLYPAKNEEMLEDMMDVLKERNSEIQNKIETRFKKKNERLFEIIQKFQPEKVQIYPVLAPAFN